MILNGLTKAFWQFARVICYKVFKEKRFLVYVQSMRTPTKSVWGQPVPNSIFIIYLC